MPPNALRLSSFVDTSRVHLDLSGNTKAEVLRELVATLGLEPQDEAAILRTLLHRESLGSTGIGRGIAVPHCRTPIAKRLQVVYGRRPGGIPYDAIDGEPVTHIFLLIAPPVEISNEYLPVLGRIAQLAKEPDTPARLAAAKIPEDFLYLLAEMSV
jgi:mannitol/fructose-specific phosphotransferase system IIA component (Ntr-type)